MNTEVIALETFKEPQAKQSVGYDTLQSGSTPAMSQNSVLSDGNISDGQHSSNQNYQPGEQQSICQNVSSVNAFANHDQDMDQTYKDSLLIADMHRRRAMNFLKDNEIEDTVPQYGHTVPDVQMITVYVRCILSLPEDPITRPLTNPRVVHNYKMILPNTFKNPWFKDFQFIHILAQRTITVIENNFPCTLMSANYLEYKLEAESVYFNYQSANQLMVSRLNIPYLYHMEPTVRAEHLQFTTPEPLPYTTISGYHYDACYDISILMSNIQRRKPRSEPANHNQLILIENIDNLAKHRADSILCIYKLLQIYHDYRMAEKKPLTGKPTKSTQNLTIDDKQFASNKKAVKFENPIPTTIPTQQEFSPPTIPCATNYTAPPAQAYVPPHKRLPETTQAIILQNNQQQLQQQQLDFMHHMPMQQQAHVQTQPQPQFVYQQPLMQIQPLYQPPPQMPPIPPLMQQPLLQDPAILGHSRTHYLPPPLRKPQYHNTQVKPKSITQKMLNAKPFQPRSQGDRINARPKK